MGKVTRSNSHRRGVETIEWIAIGVFLAVLSIGGYRVLATKVEQQTARVADCIGGAGACSPGATSGVSTGTASQGTGASAGALSAGGPSAAAAAGVGAGASPWDRALLLGSSRGAPPPSVTASVNYDEHTVAPVEGPLFVNGASGLDVVQGELADCYLLASLAAMAHQNPKFVENMVRETKDGYAVTFAGHRGTLLSRIRGGTTVQVDNRLPVALHVKDPRTGQNVTVSRRDQTIFASVGKPGSRELWAAIMESAYAKLEGGYQAIGNRGWVPPTLETLTGQPSTRRDVSTMGIADLATLIAEGHAVVVGTPPVPQTARSTWPAHFRDDTLAFLHAYWVESVDTAAQTVTLRDTMGWRAQNPADGAIVLSYADFQSHIAEIISNPITPRCAEPCAEGASSSPVGDP